MSDERDSQETAQPRPRRARIVAPVVLIILIVVIANVMSFWTDLMWFGELGQRDVMVTRISWSLGTGVAAGLLAAIATGASCAIALRVARNDLYVPFLARPVDQVESLPDQPVVPHFVLRPVSLAVTAIVAVIVGISSAGSYDTILRFAGRSDFGVSDPVFGHDASFYVFTVPFLELMLNLCEAAVLIAAITTALLYLAAGVIRYLPAPRIARPAAVHLVAMGSIFMVMEALRFRLSGWNLVVSEHGEATGVGFTDLWARLPGTWVMTVASIAIAIAAPLLARRARWKRLSRLAIGWVALAVITGGLVPGLVQRTVVEPAERRREDSVLKGNLRLTRIAYQLNDVSKRPFRESQTLTETDLRAGAATLDNVRLWSPSVLLLAMRQLQELRSYYEFSDVDVDRYTIDGRQRQVMLAAREIVPEKVSGRQSWVKQRLQYTHGYGVAAASPDLATSTGRPEFLLRDIPPRGGRGLEVKRPGVYFGERPSHYVVVNTRQKEFDYAAGDGNRQTRYRGRGGIPVRGATRRAALSWYLRDPKILLSGEITAQSRVMLRRNIKERVQTLAPFLELDRDPYLVLHRGRMVWMIDAYTSTDRFPYSTRILLGQTDQVNYVRNSVKAVVDAYDGSVTMYVTDKRDPVLASWRKAFPSLFTDLSKMPRDLKQHMRYPEDLFEVQTELWRTYHMTSIDTLYAKEDLWEVPTIPSGSGRTGSAGTPMAPFYVMARLPGEKQEEMLLIRPMVPKERRNMIAWMAARMDGRHYGETVTYTMPKQTLTQGPGQVSSLIKQDPEIAEQLTLWSRQGTTPLAGDLVVLPLQNTLVYVQPYYLASDDAALPVFERVVVAVGDTVAWGSTLDEAFRNVLAERARTAQEESAGDKRDRQNGDNRRSDGDEPPTDTPSRVAGPTGSTDATLAEIGRAWERARACQQRGDNECYGHEIDSIGQLLSESGLVDEPAPTRKR